MNERLKIAVSIFAISAIAILIGSAFGFSLTKHIIASLTVIPLGSRSMLDQVLLAFGVIQVCAILSLIAFGTLLVVRRQVQHHPDGPLVVDVNRLAMIAKHTTNAVVLTDRNRRINWVNDGFTRLTGYRLEEVIGRSPGTFLQFSKTDPQTIQKLRDCLRGGQGYCGEIYNRSKDGREYWIYIDIQPLHSNEGALIGYLGIESDVTELKRATQGLAEAKEQTECALDGGKLSIWRWDLQAQVIHLDTRFFQIVQFDLATTCPQAELILDRIHPDDLPNVRQVVSDCTEGKLPYFEVEFRLLNDAGVYKWMLSRGRGTSWNSDGNVNQLIGTVVEVTDRKNVEVALRESEAKTSAVFNYSIDAIMIMEDLTIVDCNAPAVSMFGFSKKSDLLGTHIEKLTPEIQSNGKNSHQYAVEITQLINEAGQARFEWTHKRQDGTKFEVDVSYSNLEISGRKAQLAVVRDISKKKELERQLSQAQKLESIGQLSAGIAHEVNTPMQCVYSNVEFFKNALPKIFALTNAYREAIDALGLDTNATAKLKQAEKECRIETIGSDCMEAVIESAEAANRVIEIIRAMKTMSHPGTSQLSKTNLNNLIKDASLISRSRWRNAASFEFDFDSAIGDVAILPAQMSQVILNLIVNAADAIVERNGHEIDRKGIIRAATRFSNGGIVIEISDTGIGMDERTKERVFDPFFTTKEVGKGTGQGLAIAYDVVVRQHLGQITVESTPGIGTTFKVWLPTEYSPTLQTPLTTSPKANMLQVSLT